MAENNLNLFKVVNLSNGLLNGFISWVLFSRVFEIHAEERDFEDMRDARGAWQISAYRLVLD